MRVTLTTASSYLHEAGTSGLRLNPSSPPTQPSGSDHRGACGRGGCFKVATQGSGLGAGRLAWISDATLDECPGHLRAEDCKTLTSGGVPFVSPTASTFCHYSAVILGSPAEGNTSTVSRLDPCGSCYRDAAPTGSPPPPEARVVWPASSSASEAAGG